MADRAKRTKNEAPQERPEAVSHSAYLKARKGDARLESVPFEDHLSTVRSRKFDESYPNVVKLYGLEDDKKKRYVAFATEFFGIEPEKAEADYEILLSRHFNSASQHEPMAEPAARPLCVPEGEPEKYLGKGKSGEIYTFLRRIYPFREGAEPLSIGYLQEHDPKALVGFRSRRRTAPVPSDLLALTREGISSKQDEILERHDVDISTVEGQAEAKKLMSAIGNRLYRP